MALFGKATEEEKKEETVAAVKPAASAKASTEKMSSLASRLLSRPRITEKAYALNGLNQYVFEVAKEATKLSIKRAVEEAYGVSVIAVNIVRLPAKKRLSGRNRTVSFKGSIKKAIISVKKGQAIELFKGGI
jgi:large subunit ribosomal protein L23